MSAQSSHEEATVVESSGSNAESGSRGPSAAAVALAQSEAQPDAMVPSQATPAVNGGEHNGGTDGPSPAAVTAVSVLTAVFSTSAATSPPVSADSSDLLVVASPAMTSFTRGPGGLVVTAAPGTDSPSRDPSEIVAALVETEAPAAVAAGLVVHRLSLRRSQRRATEVARGEALNPWARGPVAENV